MATTPKRQTANQHYHLQLVSNGSVVLVELKGYESEIFYPTLQRGRIVLTNIIYNRQAESYPEIGSAIHANRMHAQMGRQPTSYFGNSYSNGNRFSLKLISNANVVLVECNSYQSEIFIPQICGNCIGMKRLLASELMQFASLRPKASAGSLVANKLIVNPMFLIERSLNSLNSQSANAYMVPMNTPMESSQQGSSQWELKPKAQKKTVVPKKRRVTSNLYSGQAIDMGTTHLPIKTANSIAYANRNRVK